MAAEYSDNESTSGSTIVDMCTSEDSMLSELDRSMLHVVTGEADSHEVFFAAMRDWNVTEVQRLLDLNIDLIGSKCPDSGNSPLHVASLMGHLDVVKILVEAGGDVNSRNASGYYPLSCAVDNNVDVIRYLHEHGANINATNNSGQCALHISVQRGYEESVQELIEAQCDPNIQDIDGDTALHYAIRTNRTDLVLILMTSPTIDPGVKNVKGHNACQFAKWMENNDSIQLIAGRRPSLVRDFDAIRPRMRDTGCGPSPLGLLVDDSFQGAHVIKDVDDELTFIKQIGKGGYGTVHRGKWRETSVAIKKIPVVQDVSIQKEVHVHKRAIHPNIVRLMAYCYRSDCAVLVMELIEGHNLRDVIFKEGINRLEFRDKVYISKALLTALAFLHRSRILHLDIKPSNILIDGNNKPYICDLGLARLKSSNASMMSSRPDTPAQSNGGTHRYLAPENYSSDGSSTAACDVWSMAASLLEMFSEKLFWPQILKLSDLMRRLRREYVFPDTLYLVDDVIEDILTPCFEKDPRKRPTASDLLVKFESLDS